MRGRGWTEGTSVPSGGEGKVKKVSHGDLSDVGMESDQHFQGGPETGDQIVARHRDVGQG